jgi:DNA-binding MarR family transcriptional regulator
MQRLIGLIFILGCLLLACSVFGAVTDEERQHVLEEGIQAKIIAVESPLELTAQVDGTQWTLYPIGVQLSIRAKTNRTVKREATREIMRLVLGNTVYLIRDDSVEAPEGAVPVWIYYAQGYYLLNEDLIERGTLLYNRQTGSTMSERLEYAQQIANTRGLGDRTRRAHLTELSESNIPETENGNQANTTPADTERETSDELLDRQAQALLSEIEMRIRRDLEHGEQANDLAVQIRAHYNMGVFKYYTHENAEDVSEGLHHLAEAVELSEREDTSAMAYLAAMLLTRARYFEAEEQEEAAEEYQTRGQNLFRSLIDNHQNVWHILYVRVVHSLQMRKTEQDVEGLIAIYQQLMEMESVPEDHIAPILERYATFLQVNDKSEEAQAIFAQLSQEYSEYLNKKMKATPHQEILMDVMIELR